MSVPIHSLYFQGRLRRAIIGLFIAFFMAVLLLLGDPFLPGQPVRAAPGDTYTVTTTGDDTTTAACSGSSPNFTCTTLRDAITEASLTEGGTIDLTGLSGTITLVADMETIPSGMTIRGPGPATLTIDGDGAYRQFTIGSNDFPDDTVIITGLTLNNGSAFEGGSVYIDYVTLVLEDVIITNSFSSSHGGAIYIENQGEMHISRSTLDSNTAGEGNGGGIYAAGSVTVTETTISNNSAFEGGGIYVAGSAVEAVGTLTMINSTVSSNDATDGSGGGIYLDAGLAAQVEIRHSTITLNNVEDESNSGGLYAGSTVLLDHTIIAGNTLFAALGFPESAECQDNDTFILASSYNLLGVDGAASGCNPGATDITPPAGVELNDILTTTLADNGGPTFTHALVAGGAAHNAGNAGIAGAPATDQRGPGFDRISTTIDIGAYEVQEFAAQVTLSKTANPASLPEPGGNVTFTVVVTNTAESGQDVIVTALEDDVYGNIADPGNANLITTTCRLPSATLTPNTSYNCNFQVAVTGDPGEYTDTITATLTASNGTAGQIQASATVALTDLLPTISVSKTVTPTSLIAPGGTVTFALEVQNTSAEPVTLTAFNDSNPGVLLQQSTCGLGTVLPINGTCTYTASVTITGNAGDSFTGTVAVTAQDNEGNSTSASDSATVTLTDSLTAITLARFTAQRGNGGVDLVWETGMEANTWGFHLWRSRDGTRANAIRVTDTLILAQGSRSAGAVYRWTDSSAVAGTTYSYWLEEVEINGTSNVYGPAGWLASTQRTNQVFLPLLVQ